MKCYSKNLGTYCSLRLRNVVVCVIIDISSSNSKHRRCHQSTWQSLGSLHIHTSWIVHVAMCSAAIFIGILGEQKMVFCCM